MSRSDLADTHCPVSRAIERVGDPWVLMILREMFMGRRRFDDMQRLTGASPHILSQRLKRMCADGILEKRAYSERPVRYEYHLTEKGRDLWPVIIMLKSWSDKWLGTQGMVELQHKSCGNRIIPKVTCPECAEPLDARQISVDIDPALLAENRARRAKDLQGEGHERDTASEQNKSRRRHR
ncbi:helix-turn-helix transcriptional regulator [Tropicibacter sp. R16_0]|uniref:winged helix-turn-helix transcriptional regulator n=1 Tax=Tropicibacter sp. R16_0 TaxID=2821102 RepID=UPI001ADCF7C5|nr:helix-turn-helix domain-containing protein [Tropicibacter sp. R16_0]MBO9449694.1 helix-turn-helix transcriptional regulator [Tropicibacter sp. R16_0]